MKLLYSSLTDKGSNKERTQNEDAFLNDEDLGLFIVADGMGGYQAGDVASKMALSSMIAHLKVVAGDKGFTEKNLRDAIQVAHESIGQYKKIVPSISQLGTTLVMLVPGDKEMYVFHVGDSRCYSFSKGNLKQVTQDHNAEKEVLPDFMQGLSAFSKITGGVSRALGASSTVEAEKTMASYERDDIFLLCSDGLYEMLSEQIIVKFLKKKGSLGNKCKWLVDEANKKGGHDNITVTLVQIKDDQGSSLDCYEDD